MDRFTDVLGPDGFMTAHSRTEQQRLRRGVARGELVTVAPGVHVRRGTVIDAALRIRALPRIDPDAILLGGAAASITWWPELAIDEVVASRRGARASVAGYRWVRVRPPDDLLVATERLRIAAPALSVIQLTASLGGTAIDEALRRRAVSLDQLWSAHRLLAGRRGSRAARDLLLDSRDEPWSFAERVFHRHFRAVGCLVPYATNHPVALDSGLAFLDLAIPALMLSFEVDGYAHHGDAIAFERDRERSAQLACLGWQEVRWSARFIERQGAATRRRLRAIIAARAAALGLAERRVLRGE